MDATRVFWSGVMLVGLTTSVLSVASIWVGEAMGSGLPVLGWMILLTASILSSILRLRQGKNVVEITVNKALCLGCYIGFAVMVACILVRI